MEKSEDEDRKFVLSNAGTNTGIGNTGNNNKGSCNTGDWNKCDHSSGFLCTETQPIYIFNKPTNLDHNRISRMQSILFEFKTCKEEGFQNNNQKIWDHMNDYYRNTILNFPNFDATIFKEITGVDVTKEEKE